MSTVKMRTTLGFLLAASLAFAAAQPAGAADATLAGPPLLSTKFAPAQTDKAVESEGEVIVTIYRFIYPGMPEKRGCRIRVDMDNRTPKTVGFFGKFRTEAKHVEIDTWFTTAINIKPKENVSRLYSCVSLGDTVFLDRESSLGYPNTCEIDGVTSSPCSYKVRLVSDMKVVGGQ